VDQSPVHPSRKYRDKVECQVKAKIPGGNQEAKRGGRDQDEHFEVTGYRSLFLRKSPKGDRDLNLGKGGGGGLASEVRHLPYG